MVGLLASASLLVGLCAVVVDRCGVLVVAAQAGMLAEPVPVVVGRVLAALRTWVLGRVHFLVVAVVAVSCLVHLAWSIVDHLIRCPVLDQDLPLLLQFQPQQLPRVFLRQFLLGKVVRRRHGWSGVQAVEVPEPAQVLRNLQRLLHRWEKEG